MTRTVSRTPRLVRMAGAAAVLAVVVTQRPMSAFGQNGPSSQTGTPNTVSETVQVPSTHLNEVRTIRVYFPASYQASAQRYPVVYVLDGEALGPIVANAADFLTGYSTVPQMPDALIVAVTNSSRNRDMPVPEGYGGGGEKRFLEFLADELIPVVEQRYRTSPLRLLVGHSQGGTFVHYALATRPDAFQWYLALDAPLIRGARPILEEVRRRVTQDPGFDGRLVSVEALHGWKDEWASLSPAASKKFVGAQVPLKDETHETMAYKGIYEGLKRLFSDYAPNLVRDNTSTFTLGELDARYRTLSDAYHYQVSIPRQILVMSASRNISMQRGAEAVELIARAVREYGDSPSLKRLMTTAEEAVKKGRDTRFEEWASMAPPSITSMKPFLGTWIEKMTGDFQGVFEGVLTFSVEGDVVRARYSGHPPTGDVFELQVLFVRVVDGTTLQWGIRNGNGPGVSVHTGKLTGGVTLVGTVEQVGFLGRQRPPREFTFARRQ